MENSQSQSQNQSTGTLGLFAQLAPEQAMPDALGLQLVGNANGQAWLHGLVASLASPINNNNNQAPPVPPELLPLLALGPHPLLQTVQHSLAALGRRDASPPPTRSVPAPAPPPPPDWFVLCHVLQALEKQHALQVSLFNQLRQHFLAALGADSPACGPAPAALAECGQDGPLDLRTAKCDSPHTHRDGSSLSVLSADNGNGNGNESLDDSAKCNTDESDDSDLEQFMAVDCKNDVIEQIEGFARRSSSASNGLDADKSSTHDCIICHRTLSCRSALQMHYRTHTGEKPFRCKLCGRAFSTKGNLKTHIGIHRTRKLLNGASPPSGASTSQNVAIPAHSSSVLSASGALPFAHSIPFVNSLHHPALQTYCPVFAAGQYIPFGKANVGVQENEDAPKPRAEGSFLSVASMLATENQLSNLPVSSALPHNAAMQTKDVPASSTQPNESEDAKVDMPLARPRIVKQRNTTCELCFKRFACRSALEIHLRSHTKERPFKCPQCERAFSTKGNMKQHTLTHRNKLNASSELPMPHSIVKGSMLQPSADALSAFCNDASAQVCHNS